jgi:hypothetical protein
VSGDELHGDDGQVHHEDRAPGEVLEEPPTQRRADHDPETGDPRPHCDGLDPLGGNGEHVGQNGEGGGHRPTSTGVNCAERAVEGTFSLSARYELQAMGYCDRRARKVRGAGTEDCPG